MRELTFRGFLAQYVRQLSSNDTNSLYKLMEEVTANNLRLREPLLLFALYTDKQDVLLRASKATQFYDSYFKLLTTYTVDSMTMHLKTQSTLLPEEYLKVWRSYLTVKNRNQTDDFTKDLMRKKIKRLQEQTGITTYRIYTDLNLNKGNVSAWLKHGQNGKVSLETARKTLQYLESISMSIHPN